MPGLPNDEFLRALGAMSYTWAYLETSLDMLIALTFQCYGGKHKHKEIPKALGRKLDYLRDASKLPSLATDREAIASITTAVHDIKEKRHDAIHGAVADFSDEGVATLYRFLYEKTFHRTKEVKVSTADLAELTRKTTILSEQILDLARSLLDRLGLDDPNQATG